MNAVRFDPQGPFKRDPLAPHPRRDRLPRTPDVFVPCHLGVPRLDRDRWSLTIDGMVERPCTLPFDDLLRYPQTEVASVPQCCGSPLALFEPTRRVCNVKWGGCGWSTCWPIVGHARPHSTCGRPAWIPVPSAAWSSRPTSRICRWRGLLLMS